MNKKATLLAVYFKPIRLAVRRSEKVIDIFLHSFPTIKHKAIRNPLQLMNTMPALKMVKRGFYTNIRIRLKASSVFEQASVQEILLRQSALMRKMMAENSEALKAEVMANYRQRQEQKNRS